jgi:hypothetical protein
MPFDLSIRLKKAVRASLKRLRGTKPTRRHDGALVGGVREREIAQASPERAGELAGHSVERVDT